MIEATENKTYTFEEIWENFASQLNEARIQLNNKEEEIQAEAAHMTRIDLTEFNDLRTAVIKLEAALETMDILRVNLFKQESLIVKQ